MLVALQFFGRLRHSWTEKGTIVQKTVKKQTGMRGIVMPASLMLAHCKQTVQNKFNKG